jgi:hypothetical protein
MHARYDRATSIDFLTAALLAGTATISLSPGVTSARAEEDHSAHHSQAAQASPQGEAQSGEHGGHSGMHGQGMHSGGMMGGGMMGGGMGCGMMGGHGGQGEKTGGHGDMKGGDMRKMMHEMMTKMISRADERVTELKTELKISEAQLPQWTAFADSLRSAAQAMERLHKEMMPASKAAPTPQTESRGDTSYPDFGAIAKGEGGAPAVSEEKRAKTLPERLDNLEKRLTQHLENLKAIKASLDPLYATFSDDQKKVADGLMVGPMGVM